MKIPVIEDNAEKADPVAQGRRPRAKIDKPFDQEPIHTVRGAGYSLHAPG